MRTTLLAAAALAAGLGAGLGAGTVSAQTITMWTTEEQLDRLHTMREIAGRFEFDTGILVEVLPVTQRDLGARVAEARAADDLPDVVYFPLEWLRPWAEAGILDADAATTVVRDVGEETFAPGALATARVDDAYAAVPVDGWTQMLLYRADLFEEHGLAPPTTYADVLAAVEVLHDPPSMYGFVAPTKVDEPFMSQVLEHVLLANGASPVSADGIAGFDPGRLAEALEFYRALAAASPPGEIYWRQARDIYLDGRAAMIVWSPLILDELAGLRSDVAPGFDGLARSTGVVTTLSGPSNPDGAAWASINYFGITTAAPTAAAERFVAYLMDEGYEGTLSLAPEGKFPIRRGDAEDPDRFVRIWQTLPVGVDREAPLADLYPAAVIADITRGLDTAGRWGLAEGDLAAASRVVNSQIVNRVVRAVVDGELTVGEAVARINAEIAALE